MPISTTSEAWKEGEEIPRFHKTVLAFLRDHPHQAYRQEEIADELLNSTFLAEEERERLQEELSEEEYNERRSKGELPGGDDHYPMSNLIQLRHVGSPLSQLREYGLVQAREIDAESFDLPETETVNLYTYDGHMN